MNSFLRPFVPLLTLFLLMFADYSVSQDKIVTPAAPELSATSYFLQDYNSLQVLAEKDPDMPIPPASLTKMMTVYATLKEIKQGSLALTDQVVISEKAWKTGGSRMFLQLHSRVSVDDLLKGIIIQSGNDACVAIAEHIAGAESTFAQLMNEYAKKLGMSNTHFVNSTGMPDDEHYTTARDLARLARALIKDFPEHYKLHAVKEFTYNKIKQHNRNSLLWRDESVDGIKTGHTEAAGYCLVASAKREGMRLISVVMGTKSVKTRTSESQSLLNYGFRFFETRRLFQANKPLTESRIWKGQIKQVELGVLKDLYATTPRRQFSKLEKRFKINKKIIAPVKKGQKLGEVTVTLDGKLITKSALVSLESIEPGSFIQRMYDKALLMMEK